ncbi:MAG TPA: response regulator transcription factor [Candidatus Acidoferrales bacterium]|nr:response regulator transcription factor [Candidatus Acidoferrales bacterium]
MSPKYIAEVYLLAENRLLREALVRLLAKKDIRVVGASPYSDAALEEIIEKEPGIIVLDSSGLAFSNSSLISTLQTSITDVKIVMVDMESDEHKFLRAVREGVVGYVLKDASALEVAATIRAVAGGEAVCPPALSIALFRFVSQQPSPSASNWRTDLGLSRREQELLELLRERLTNKEIAAQLNLSEQTVKNHVHNILRKVGAADRLSVVELCDPDRFRSNPGNVA